MEEENIKRRWWINTGFGEINKGAIKNWDDVVIELDELGVYMKDENGTFIAKEWLTEEEVLSLLSKIEAVFEKYGVEATPYATAQPECPKCGRLGRFSEFYCPHCGSEMLPRELLSI